MVSLPSRLLVVEDDPHDVELFRLALEDYPFGRQLDVVGDGEQALIYLLGQNDDPPPRPLPRLVLLDLKLPKIDGLQVLETLRQHPRTQQLVVVVMTSSAEGADIQTCYALGVNSYVVKPLDFQQFQEVAQRVGQYWMQLNQPAQ
jgi:CheY-like chemotaxis protein